MSTALAVFVAAGFVWSLILFFGAVFMDERDQEGGFGWALAGAVVYLITFSDHLPGTPTGTRALLDALPGVTHEASLFASPVAVICALAGIYALRILIFYQLFGDLSDIDVDGDGHADDVNDLVAPVFSYVCFAISAATAIAGMYELPVSAGLTVGALALALYFLPVITRLLRPYLEVAYETVRSVVIVVGSRVQDAVVLLIVGIGRAQLVRLGQDTTKADRRAATRRETSNRRRAEAQGRRAEAIAKLGRSKEESDQRRQRRRSRSSPRNPNIR